MSPKLIVFISYKIYYPVDKWCMIIETQVLRYRYQSLFFFLKKNTEAEFNYSKEKINIKQIA